VMMEEMVLVEVMVVRAVDFKDLAQQVSPPKKKNLEDRPAGWRPRTSCSSNPNVVFWQNPFLPKGGQKLCIKTLN